MGDRMIRLLLLFTLLPLAELWLLIEVGRRIGTLSTIGLVAATGLLGVLLARSEGLTVLRRLFDNLERGVLPGDELLDGIFILIGGAFLLTPGLITDTLGFVLLIPFTRRRIKSAASRYIRKRLERGSLRFWWRR